MAAQGVHKITEDFEKELCRYTGAPFAIALDNQSNALFLALYYEKYINKSILTDHIIIPAATYPSVPCEIIHAGLKVEFQPVEENTLSGAYILGNSNVWDSALRFTADMYDESKHNSHMCISFTGPYKRLKLGKGGAILTDSSMAYNWFKKARFSGRGECSYHNDDFDKDGVIGWNFYMPTQTSALGLHMMNQFYDTNGNKIHHEDQTLPYPDLSQFKCFQYDQN